MIKRTKPTTTDSSATNNELSQIKAKLVDLLGWIVIIFMWFALLGTLLRIREFGITPLNYYHVAMAMVLLSTFVWRNLMSWRLRAWILLMVIFTVGAGGILTYGLLSQGVLLLLLFVVLAAILINKLWGIISLTTVIVFFIVCALLFRFKLLTIQADVELFVNSLSSWAMLLLLFSIVTAVIFIFWNKTLQFLTQKIESSNLHEANLQRINRLLSKEIENRRQTELLLKKQIDESKKLNQEYQQINQQLNQTNQQLEESNLMLHEAKEKAQAADQLKSSFLSNMSHEVRTPMNAIVGFTTLLKGDDINTSETHRYLDIIQTSTNNLLHVISDIMLMARLESGQYTLNPELFDINTLIEELTKRYTREIFILKEHKLTFSIINSIPNPCPLISDLEGLKQIATKLIDNAIKFTDQGHIDVFIDITPKNKLNLTVKDTGIGISKKIKSEIYESFRQLDDQNTRKYGGTGIGLSIVKALVELMNGTIEFVSIPGKETIFSVSIPVKPHLKKQKEIQPTDLNLLGKTLLIIGKHSWEDEKLKALLHKTQATLVYAERARQALELLEQNQMANLIIVNLYLPYMPAPELVKNLKENYPDLPVIAHNTVEKELVEFIPEPIGDAVVQNPIDENQFIQLLRNYLK
jgi:signal transduction histidine kinase/CheY-like chemotaxis protein